MLIPVKVFFYLDSKMFYSITNFNLLTAYLKVKMLSDLVRYQPLNNKKKIIIHVFIYFCHRSINVEKISVVCKV